jgi:hypothetical protein
MPTKEDKQVVFKWDKFECELLAMRPKTAAVFSGCGSFGSVQLLRRRPIYVHVVIFRFRFPFTRNGSQKGLVYMLFREQRGIDKIAFETGTSFPQR